MSEETFALEEDLGFEEAPGDLTESSFEVVQDFLDPAEYDMSTQEADPDLVEDPLLYEELDDEVPTVEVEEEPEAIVLDFTGSAPTGTTTPYTPEDLDVGESGVEGEVVQVEAPTPGAVNQSPEFDQDFTPVGYEPAVPTALPPEYHAAMEQMKFETGQAEEVILETQAEAVQARAEAMEAHGLASEATTTAQDAHNASVDAKDAAIIANQTAGTAKDAAEAAAREAAAAAGIGQAAQLAASSKADVLIQSDEPVAEMQKSTTLWIDTTDGANTPKRWDGDEWVEVTDKAATDAARVATEAQKAADQAVSNVNNLAEVAVVGSIPEYAVNTSETSPPSESSSLWSSETPTRAAGSFIWWRLRITYGDDTTALTAPALFTGNTGAKGDPGSQGIPGPPGPDGKSLYTWLKYADTPTSGMSDLPDGKTYMGIAYNQTSATESSDYSKYSWSLIKGEPGVPGIEGPAGVDGESLFTWIKYANDANGTGMHDLPDGKTHIGIAYNKPTATESTKATDYQWSLIQGPKGDPGSQGIPGAKGDDGITYYTWLKYADTPTTGMSDSPTGKTYMGIAYNQTSATESTDYSKYSWSLIKGEQGDQGIPGAKGDDGVTTYTWIKYANDAKGTGMSDLPDGKTYIGLAFNKTTQTESSAPGDYQWSLIQGPKGDPGSQGIPGAKGDDGITYYTWLKYADTPTTGMSDDPAGKTYMGIAYNQTSATESSKYSDYSWSLIKGEQGVQGIPGAKGDDGVTTYTWVKYANDANGTGMHDLPAGKTHIGLAFNKTTATESTKATDYQWSLIQGPKGDKGDTGSDGAPGAAGVGLDSTVISYAQTTSGTVAPTSGWQSTVPTLIKGRYLWTRSVWTYTDESTETGYSVAYVPQDGADGDDGLPGAPGVGITNTTITYAQSTSGTTAPASGWQAQPPSPVAGRYVWTKTVWTYSDGNTETGYSVGKIGETGAKGDKGADGVAGKDGVGLTGTVISYAKSTSATTTPGSAAWGPNPPTPTKGQYLWTRTVWTYSDGSTETGYSTAYWATDGAKGDDGVAGKDGVGITGTDIKYAVNSSGTTAPLPSANWQATPPAASAGQFMWTRTIWTYSDNSTETGYSVGKIGNTGAKGDPGSQGIPGVKGDDGITYYTWLKYADTPTSGMSDSPTGKKYMGIAYNQTTSTESTKYSDYSWSLIQGPQGNQGIPGAKGDDGVTTYTWVKYANDANGTGMSDLPTGKTYVGLAFNKTTATESTKATDYQWSLIQGPKGAKGDKGVSVDGITTYFYRTAGSKPDVPTTATPPDGWTTVEPDYLAGTTLYRVEKATLSDGSFSYTPVSVSSAFTAAASAKAAADDAARDAATAAGLYDNLQIGGRNLLVRSGELVDYQIPNAAPHLPNPAPEGRMNAVMAGYIPVTEGETLMLTKGTSAADDGGWWRYTWHDASEAVIARDASRSDQLLLTVPSGATLLRVSYPYDSYPKIERGNKATDWTPAPEDVDAGIAAAQGAADSAASMAERGLNLVNNTSRSGTADRWSSSLSSTNLTVETVDFNGTPIRALAIDSLGNSQIYSDYFDVDVTKAYEIRFWALDPTTATSTQFYFGMNVVKSLGGTATVTATPVGQTGSAGSPSSNLYFTSNAGATPAWKEFVGYLLPYGANPAIAKGLGKNVALNVILSDPSTNQARMRVLNWSNGSNRRTLHIAHMSVTETTAEAIVRAQAANVLADGKADVLIQSTAPAVEMRKSTTLWIDTTPIPGPDGVTMVPGNKPKRWQPLPAPGKWVEITDKAAKDAAQAAVDAKKAADDAQKAADEAQKAADEAQKTADEALDAAGTAQTTASNALTSANGRNSRIVSTGDATGTTNPRTGKPLVEGDTWWKWDNNTSRNVIGAWVFRNGKWETEKIRDEVLSSLDVNKLVVTGSAYMRQAVLDKIISDAGYFKLLTAERLAVAPPTNMLAGVERWDAFGANDNDKPWRNFGHSPADKAMWAQGTRSMVVEQELEFTAGTRYRFEVDVKASVADTRFLWELAMVDGTRITWGDLSSSDNANTNAGYPFYSTPVPGTGWNSYWAEGTAQVSGVARLRIWPNHSSGASNPTGYQWFRNPRIRAMVGGVLIENGAVTAEKITADLSMANHFSGLMATFGEAFIGKVKADYVNSGSFSGKTFNGGTFIGSTFRTSGSVPRVEITSAGLKAFDSNGDETVNIWGNGGRLQGTTITGGTVRTADTGARIQMTGGLFQVVNSSGREIIKIDPAFQPPGSIPAQPALVFGANVSGSPARMAMYGGDVWFMNGTYVVGSLRKSPGTDMYLENNDGSTNTRITNVGTQGNIYIDAGSGGIYESSNWHNFNIVGATNGYRTWAIRPIANGGVTRAVLQFTGGGANMPQTTVAANVMVDSNGSFWRTSSARRFKNDIQDIGVDPYRVLDVPVRDWVDAAIAMDDDSYRTRTPGVVAEEVEAVGLEQFVTYDEDGQTSGVLYDRLPLLLIPVVRDLHDRLERLENQT